MTVVTMRSASKQRLADALYNRRRPASSIVTLACNTTDETCFCTSVGLSPASERGSDVMLFDIGEDTYDGCLEPTIPEES